MRALLLAVLLALIPAAEPAVAASGDQAYDAALAKRLGADERGMKPYVLAILKAGPHPAPSDDERKKLFMGHMANINRLADEGKLLIAGPMGENAQNYEGIFVFNVATVDEAKALVASDPAIAAGALSVDLYQWYGSAALQEVTAIHRRIDKTKR